MKVKVYSTPICTWCNRLNEFLRDNEIEFEDFNVVEDKQAAREVIYKSDQLGVPVTDIDGKIIIGFDKKVLEKELRIRGGLNERNY